MLSAENATITLCYEGRKLRLGTLAVALPFGKGESPLSSILLGEKDTILCRALAERVTLISGKISLVSLFLKDISATNAGKALFKAVEDMLGRG